MKIKINDLTFKLKNKAKLVRVIDGTPGPKGELKGGVGPTADPAVIIAEYDKLGGFITCQKGDEEAKVKTGSFYDFKNRTIRKEPKIVFVFRDINGEEVEIDEDDEVPISVRAASAAKRKKAKKVKTTEEIDAEEDEEEEIEEDDEIADDLQDGEEIEEVPAPKKKKGSKVSKRK